MYVHCIGVEDPHSPCDVVSVSVTGDISYLTDLDLLCPEDDRMFKLWMIKI